MCGILCLRAKCESSEQVAPRLGGPGLQSGAHLVISPGGWEWDSVAKPSSKPQAPHCLSLLQRIWEIQLATPHPHPISFFFLPLIYLLQAVQGVHCSMFFFFFSPVVKRGWLLFITGCGFLYVMASLVVQQGLHSTLLQHTGSAALWHVGSSHTRGWTCVSCIVRQILYHWTIRKAPSHFLKII